MNSNPIQSPFAVRRLAPEMASVRPGPVAARSSAPGVFGRIARSLRPAGAAVAERIPARRPRLGLLAVALAAALPLGATRAAAEPMDQWRRIEVAANVLKSPNEVIFVDGRYVAVGTDGRIQYSSDGYNWTVIQTPITRQLLSVAYGNGRYVAVGFNRSIVSSADLNTWMVHQDVENANFERYSRVFFANGMFVVVGSSGEVRRSTNCIDWSPGSMNRSDFFAEDLTWGSGLWVAVGSGSGINVVMTSPDAVTWTRRSVSFTNNFDSVAFANGLFVATGTSRVATSPDGITWTLQQNAKFYYSNTTMKVRHINGRFFVFGQFGTLKSSVDGSDWVDHNTGTTSDIKALGYNNDRLLLIRYSNLSGGSGLWESDPWAPAGGAPSTPGPIHPGPADPGPVTPPSQGADASLINIATRAYVGSGGEALIAGFVIEGTAPKRVLIRGIGPGLAAFGVDGTVADPQLKLYSSSGHVLAVNDNWSDQPEAAEVAQAAAGVGAFPLAGGSQDAALLITLQPGAYSAEITGVDNTTGVAIVEVYDTQPGNGSRLLNLSSRTQVGTGDQTTIPGIVVQGTKPRSYVIRAVGPTLAEFGLEGTLPNPRITLVSSSGSTVAANDDWSSGANAAQLVAATAAVGAFALPANSQDAALLVTLNPGAYSLLVSDATSATGVGLVEVYEVK